MEPKSHSPNVSPESRPSAPQFEQPEIVIPDHEAAPDTPQPEKQPSHHEKVGETSPKVTPASQQVQTPVALPQAPSDEGASAGGAASDDDTPLVAADDDNIEKEWVTKAKKVIAETKSDPYLQEERVSKLQADYLQKRYNKKIKLSDKW